MRRRRQGRTLYREQCCGGSGVIIFVANRSQIINQSGLEWRENSSRTDQSNLSYATGQQECHSNHLSDDCNHDNALRDVLTPPTSCLCDCHNSNKVTCLSCDCHTVQSPDIGNQVLQNQSEVGGVIGGAVGGAVLSCRQEALYYNDVSVEELAGYFDELLHIPKPMSVMAELMYT